MGLTEAQIRARNNWNKRNYKREGIWMSIKESENFNRYCKENGCSKSGLVRALLKEKIGDRYNQE